MSEDLKKVFYDVSTGKITEVKLTAEEIKQREDDSVIAKKKYDDYKSALAQKEIDAKNGNKKFLDMGLTQAEATALTGYKPPEDEE